LQRVANDYDAIEFSAAQFSNEGNLDKALSQGREDRVTLYAT
jgi:hypothetical protein